MMMSRATKAVHGSRAIGPALAAGAAFLLLIAGCEDDDGPSVSSPVDAAAGSGGAGGMASPGTGGAAAPDGGTILADGAPGGALDAAPGGSADAISSVTPDAATPPEGPLFLVHSAVETTGRRTNYFSLVGSLRERRRLDYSRSLELPGRARLYAEKGNGFFAIGEGESPTITRYELRADGSLTKGKSVSFQAYGVKSMGPQAVLFVSATKAYYRDSDQAQIIIWNPADMTVVKSIPLPRELVHPDWLLALSQWAAREGEAYFAVSGHGKQYDRVRPGTALVRIDTATDSISVTPDMRCRGLFKTGKLGEALYFFSDVINGFGHAVSPNDAGQQDCILRVSPGRTTWDPDYVGTLAAAFPGMQAATVISVTEDGRAWALVADLSVTPTQPGTTAGQWYSKGWSWAHVKLATLSEATKVPGDPGAYSGNAFIVGSDFFISQAKADYSESTLVNLGSGTPAAGVSFPGFALDVSRVR